MNRMYKALPEARTGYALDGRGGFWSVIVPIETTNLILDPTNVANDGYLMSGGNDYVDSDVHAFGAAGQRIVPNDTDTTLIYKYPPTTIGVGAHTLSVYIKAPTGMRFRLNVTPANSFPLNTTFVRSQIYVGNNSWTQYHVTWNHKVGSAVYPSISLLDDTDNRPFWIDAWQLEALPYPTTFCFGDLRGYSTMPWIHEYRWNGAPYASTSTRHAMSRSGGRVVNLLEEAFFQTTEILGAGIGEFELYTTSMGNGQIVYNGMQMKGRELTISGMLYGDSYQQLQVRRRKLIDLFKPDVTPDKQPILLQYQPVSPSGTLYGSPIVIPVVYVSGLNGRIDNHYRENLAMTFRAYGNWREVIQNTHQLTLSDEVDFTSIALRDADEWVANTQILTDTNDIVLASVWHDSSKLFVGGNDVTLGVVDGLLSRTNGTWAEIYSVSGAVADNYITGLAKLYGFYNDHIGIVGKFLFVDVEPHAGVALMDITDNSLVSITAAQGFTEPIHAIACTGNGTIYLGGEFTTTVPAGADPPVAANCIIKYNPFTPAYEVLGAGYPDNGSTGYVYTIVVGPDGNIYFGGSYENLFFSFGVGVYISKYIPDTDLFETVGDGVNSTVRALVFSPNGTLYIGGDFTQNFTNVRDIAYLGKWNGGLVQEVSGLNGIVRALAVDSQGNVHVGGEFTDNPAGDSYYGVWNGSAWIKAEIIIPRPVYTISIAPNDSIFIGTIDSGDTTTYVAMVDVIDYGGTAEMTPMITVEDIGYLEQITNLTTGTSIYFKDLYINSYEKAILDLTPGNIKFSSNSRGNLMSYILPSSNLSEWKLLPGENRILSYFRGTGASSKLYFSSTNEHHGIDIAGEL